MLKFLLDWVEYGLVGENCHVTMLTFLIHEHSMFFHLFSFTSVTLSVFSYHKTHLIHILLGFYSKYCMFLDAIINGIFDISISKC